MKKIISNQKATVSNQPDFLSTNKMVKHDAFSLENIIRKQVVSDARARATAFALPLNSRTHIYNWPFMWLKAFNVDVTRQNVCYSEIKKRWYIQTENEERTKQKSKNSPKIKKKISMSYSHTTDINERRELLAGHIFPENKKRPF